MTTGRYVHNHTKKIPHIIQNQNDVVLNNHDFTVAQMIRLEHEDEVPLYISREDFYKDYHLEESSNESQQEASEPVSEADLNSIKEDSKLDESNL